MWHLVGLLLEYVIKAVGARHLVTAEGIDYATNTVQLP